MHRSLSYALGAFLVSTTALVPLSHTEAAQTAGNLGRLLQVGNWKAAPIDATSGSTDETYCALVSDYENKAEPDHHVVLAFARDQQGLGSIALDFKNPRFKAGSDYEMRADVGNGDLRALKTKATSDRSVVAQVGKDSAFYDALVMGRLLTLDVANTKVSFDLGEFSSGLASLDNCVGALRSRTAEKSGKKISRSVDTAFHQTGADQGASIETELAAIETERKSLAATRAEIGEIRTQVAAREANAVQPAAAAAKAAPAAQPSAAATKAQAELDGRVASLEAQLKSLTSARDTEKTRADQLQKELEAARTASADMKAANAAAASNVVAANAAADQKLVAMEADLAKKERMLALREQEMKTEAARLEAERVRITSLQRDISTASVNDALKTGEQISTLRASGSEVGNVRLAAIEGELIRQQEDLQRQAVTQAERTEWLEKERIRLARLQSASPQELTAVERASLETAQSRVSELESKLAQSQKRITDMEASVNQKLAAASAGNQKAIDELKAQQAALEEKARSLAAREQELAATSAKLADETKAVEASRASIENERSKLTAERGGLSAEREQIEAQKAAQAREAAAAVAAADTEAKTAAAARLTEIQKAESALSDRQNELDRREAEMRTREDSLKSAETQLASTKNNLSSQEASLKEAQAAAQSRENAQIASAKEENERLKSELATLRAEMSNATEPAANGSYHHEDEAVMIMADASSATVTTASMAPAMSSATPMEARDEAAATTVTQTTVSTAEETVVFSEQPVALSANARQREAFVLDPAPQPVDVASMPPIRETVVEEKFVPDAAPIDDPRTTVPYIEVANADVGDETTLKTDNRTLKNTSRSFEDRVRDFGRKIWDDGAASYDRATVITANKWGKRPYVEVDVPEPDQKSFFDGAQAPADLGNKSTFAASTPPMRDKDMAIAPAMPAPHSPIETAAVIPAAPMGVVPPSPYAAPAPASSRTSAFLDSVIAVHQGHGSQTAVQSTYNLPPAAFNVEPQAGYAGASENFMASNPPVTHSPSAPLDTFVSPPASAVDAEAGLSDIDAAMTDVVTQETAANAAPSLDVAHAAEAEYQAQQAANAVPLIPQNVAASGNANVDLAVTAGNGVAGTQILSPADAAAAPRLSESVPASLQGLLRDGGVSVVTYTPPDSALVAQKGQVMYRWSTATLNGLYEEMPYDVRRDDMAKAVDGYIARYKLDCPSLQLQESKFEKAQNGILKTVNVTCPVSGNAYAAGFVFLAQPGSFAAIVHSGQPQQAPAATGATNGVANALKTSPYAALGGGRDMRVAMQPAAVRTFDVE